jgi:hypothetical protein
MVGTSLALLCPPYEVSDLILRSREAVVWKDVATVGPAWFETALRASSP